MNLDRLATPRRRAQPADWEARARLISEPAFAERMAHAGMSPDADAFIDWLMTSGEMILALPAPDGVRWIGYKPLMFHYTLMWGYMGDKTSIEGRWCYERLDEVRQAFIEWGLTFFEGEPEGWHRDPLTARRRPGGDKSKEYIAQ